MQTNFSGMTNDTTLIYTQVLEASLLESREHHRPSPSLVNSGTMIDTRNHSGTLPSELNLPCKPTAIPGTKVKTPHILTSPRPTFSEHQTKVTVLSLLQKEKEQTPSGPYTVGLSGVNANGMLCEILSPTATTRASSAESSRRDSLNSTPSPPPSPTPNKPLSFKLNITSPMGGDVTRVTSLQTSLDAEYEAKAKEYLKTREPDIAKGDKRLDVHVAELTRREKNKEPVRDRVEATTKSKSTTNTHGFMDRAPNIQPYMNIPKTQYEFQSAPFQRIKAIKDTMPRPYPFDLRWLSEMYGAPVYLSSQIATTPLRYIYIPHYNVTYDNYLQSGCLAVYLNPIPRYLMTLYADIPNTAYLIQEEVSIICPEVTLVPANPTPYSRGSRLEIVVYGFDETHPYGLPPVLTTRIVAGPTSGVYNSFPVHNPETELATVDAQVIVEEKDDTIIEFTNPTPTLTMEALQQHDAQELPPSRPSSRASSTGSNNSTCSMREELIDSIQQWILDCYTLDYQSTVVTDGKDLFDNYQKYSKDIGTSKDKFDKYMKELYQALAGKTSRTVNKVRKDIRGYKGFNPK
jgi:hypothetical protein